MNLIDKVHFVYLNKYKSNSYSTIQYEYSIFLRKV